MKTAVIFVIFFCQFTVAAQKPTKVPSTNDVKKMMQEVMQQRGVSKDESLNKEIQQAIDRAADGDISIKLPAKDVKRIAGISGRMLSYTELCNYIKQVHAAVEKKLQPGNLAELNAFYSLLKSDTLHANAVDNAASGCMILGDGYMALWLMGKASIDNPFNSNILSNYAAFLIMNGGEHLALPILKRLNYVYPKNVTILNNIGQAWFGLGDLDMAKKYLDTVQMIYPAHSQAANTQSYIAESKGDKEGAIKQARQSISSVYSRAKQKHIEKMGGKLNDEDIHWSLHMPEDALGIDKLLTERPEFYNNRGEFISLQPEWQSFLGECGNLSEKISKNAAEGMEEAMMKITPPQQAGNKIITPAFWVHKAQAKLDIESDDYNDHAVQFLEKRQEFEQTIFKYIEELQTAVAGVNDDKAACKIEKNYVQKFFELNSLMKEYYLEFTNREKRFRKNSIYYKKFIAPTQEMYEKLQQMDLIGFLAMIGQLTPIGFDPAFQTIGDVEILGKDFSECTDPKISNPPLKELPDFDVVNCKSESSFIVPKIGSITLQCNIMITELDAAFLPIHGSYKENWVKGEFIEGSIGIGGEVGIVDVGVDLNFNDKGFVDGTVKIEKEINILKGVQGPLQMGVKGVVGVEVGFGSDGIEDVTVSGDVKGSVNASGGDKENLVGKELNVKTGATASMTWNAGGFSESKGKLSNVSIAGFK